jgi:tRNA threonylcarbamoyladenosine biosynthesis protein TsaB
MHLSENLLNILDTLLKQYNLTLEAIEVFAVGVGPGSFTGTRIGVMTAKTFAAVLQKPLYGVNSLDTLAHQCRGLSNTAVFPLLPCRRESVYAAPYAVWEERVERRAEIIAVGFEDLANLIEAQPEEAVLLCGEGAELHRSAITDALQPSQKQISYLSGALPLASTIGRIAVERHQLGDTGDDLFALVPEYVAPPPITLPKRSFSLIPPTSKGENHA